MFSQPLRLRSVLLLSLGSALLLSNALTWYVGQMRQVESLRHGYFDRIFWMSHSVGSKASEWIATSNWAQLALSGEILEQQAEVVYAFIRAEDGEIFYAFDDALFEESDPRLISWDPPEAPVLETRALSSETMEYQTGTYVLREQVLKEDANYGGFVRGRAGETVFEARQELLHWGRSVGIMHVGLSQEPLAAAVAENQRSLLLIELLLLFSGLLISGWVARRVATPLQRMTHRLAGLQTSSLQKKSSLQELQYQLQELRLDDMPSNTWESQQLIEAFLQLRGELLLQIDRIQQSEQQLRLSHQELQDAYAELQQMQNQLVQSTKMASMGEMLAMIAHQWRQPLATISVITSGLTVEQQLGVSTKEKVLEKLKKIQETTQFLSRTINDFRDFFRPGRERAEVRLQDLVQRTREILELSLANQAVTIVEEYEDLPPLELYPNELQQALLNLLKNAQEALQENRTHDRKIKLRIFAHAGKQVLEVQDNAGGIPPEVLEKIFFPYFSTKSKLNGTGLGLYMSKMIVEDHLQGRLLVENRSGGACFRLELTSLPPEVSATPTLSLPATTPTAESPSSSLPELHADHS